MLPRRYPEPYRHHGLTLTPLPPSALLFTSPSLNSSAFTRIVPPTTKPQAAANGCKRRGARGKAN